MVEKMIFKAKDENLLTSRSAETIVAIAHKMRDVGRIRKNYLRNLIKASNSTFAEAINFLKKVDIIKEVMEYPNTPEGRAKEGHKHKYVKFNYYSVHKIASSVESLLAYQQVDLVNYPIRDLDKLDNDGIINLKKYIYRINYQYDEVNNKRVEQFYELLELKTPMKINSIRNLYKLSHREAYYCLKILIDKGKIDIGWNKKMKSVVVFRNFDYMYSHTRWRCENCGHWNPGSNTGFCGKCGDLRKN